MGFKRPLSVSPIFAPSENTSSETMTHTPDSTHCLVCGDKAKITNYGALSCSSCKTFFRRRGFPNESISSCSSGGYCEVNIHTRRICTACRLAKCFAVGMSQNLIRKEDLSEKKRPKRRFRNKKLIITQPVMDPPQLSTLDLIRPHQFILSTSDWTLLTNVVHVYDTCSVGPEISHFFQWFSDLSATTQLDVSQTLDLIYDLYKSAYLLIGSMADFRVLVITEQNSLFERNLDAVYNLCTHLMWRDAFFFGNLEFNNAFASVYSNDDILTVFKIIARLDPDPTLGKLMLVILAFSTCTRMIDISEDMTWDSLLLGTFHLFGSQNVYAELLWKYMQHRYGHRETVLRFSALIKHTLDMITYSANIYKNNQLHQALMSDVINQAKQALTTGEIDCLPLWGKS